MDKTIEVTLGEIFSRIWDGSDFDKLGINEWCLNEGLATREDTASLTKEKCLIFMSEHEVKARFND